MKDIEIDSPPPVLVLARVLAWARTDWPVEYTGNMLVFDGGERLGQVPNLAICQYFGDREVVLFHCDENWNVVGCSGFGIIGEMKAHAEIIYRHISGLWKEVAVSEEEDRSHLETLYEEDVCQFCTKRPVQVKQMFGSGKGLICIDCVNEFHRQSSKASSVNIIGK